MVFRQRDSRRRLGQRVTRAWGLLVSLGLFTGAVGSAAEAADDPARTHELDACASDVHRLCETFYPDEKQVAICLVDQRARLSQACAEVLARPPSDKDPE